VKTVDDLSQLFAVNTLTPYILTALITRPKRSFACPPECITAPDGILNRVSDVRRGLPFLTCGD
jgi:hypothetical protein